MNLTTPIFFAFWGLLMLLALVVSMGRVLRWRRRIRDERNERQAVYAAALDQAAQASEIEEAAVASVPEPEVSAQPTTPDEVARAPIEEPVVPVTSATAAEDDSPAEPVHETAAWTAASSARQGAGWSPPEAAPWHPTEDARGPVTWGSNQLFHTRDDQFPEPDYLPRVSPGQVANIDTSDYAFGAATPALAQLLPPSDIERTENELAQAGYHQPHAMQNLQATRFLLVFVSLLMLGGLLIVVPPQAEPWVLGAMLLIPASLWALPRILIQNRASERRSQLERSMPDMLDMLNMCVSQGLTIPDSLRRIAWDLKPVYPVLAGELAIVVQQAEVGNLRIALENLGQRVDVPEVDSFVSLMTQSERMGTSASEALTEYSTTMRESLRQRTDEKANSAAFKLMFPTVLFMMPAVFMFLMGPAILELQTFFDGGGLEQIQQGTETATGVLQQNN